MMSCKILVVDDEVAVCKELRKFLEGKGYDVVEAYDGDQAVLLYRQERPDLVLLDVRMPGKDGIDTLKELKALDPEASVIMVTAVAKKKRTKQALAEGASDYITKPFDPDSLERTLSIVRRMELLSGDE